MKEARRKPKKGSRTNPPAAPAARWRSALAPGLLLAASLAAIIVGRQGGAEKFQKLKVTSDIYAIPPEQQLVVFSLGYRAAFADLLFARTMVAAGVHFVEKRVFHHLPSYLNGILALEPRYRDVYRFSDTLLNLSTVEMPKENLWIARDIQERGLKQFPGDAELWMSTGQFIAYLAPNRMEEGKEKEEWRASGAKIIQTACEIWPEQHDIPDVCFSSARFLTEAGEREAAIRALERLVAVADDEGVRARAMAKLSRLTTERVMRKSQENLERLERLRAADLPVLGRGEYQLVAPPHQVSACIGLHQLPDQLKCASSFERQSEILRTMR